MSFSWRERGKGFCCVDCLFFIWGMERAMPHITLLVLDQKIPDWLIKIMFLGEVGTAIKLGIKVRFGILGF